MKRRLPPILCLSLLLALPVEARWFHAGGGESPLRKIARLLAADVEGEKGAGVRLAPAPEPPALPPESQRPGREASFDAEAAKSKAFAGPGEQTALIEVGIEAANVRAADLLPTVSELLDATSEPAPQTESALPAADDLP